MAVLLILIAVGLVIYPAISNKLDQEHQSYILTEYDEQVKKLDTSNINQLWAEAERYNASLGAIQLHYIDEIIEDENYYRLLNINQSGLMCHVEIPKIDANLPVYHGTSNAVLSIGIGHLQGSALPIGGEGNHSVMTGHSGVAGKKLFSDLDKVSVGDVFYIHILGKTLAYQVEAINIVLPHEAELLAAVPGKDLCTLITCTPYAVNTHRLLVTGSRIPYEEAQKVEEEVKKQTQEEPVKSTWEENYIKYLEYLGIAIGAFLVLFFGFIIIKNKRDKKKEEQKKAMRREESGQSSEE